MNILNRPTISVSEVLDYVGHDIIKQPIQYQHPKTGQTLYSRHLQVINADTGEELGVNSPSYEVIPHREVLETGLKAVTSEGWDIIQTHYDRGRVYVEAIQRHNTQVIQKDQHIPRLAIHNAYDGTRALSIHYGFYRVICTNGMMAPNNYGSVSIRHTRNAPATFQKWAALAGETDWVNRLRNDYDTLDRPLTRLETENVLKTFLKLSDEKEVHENKNAQSILERAFVGDGQNVKQNPTRYDLFQGVTEHLRDSNKQTYSSQTRIDEEARRAFKILSTLP